ncbi:MAG: 4Fe-4S binding protein [Sedimentisphaerales bacterium]|nr:4Fe-4S binding protein [Sedimentisphaerales bacterium]
MVIRNIVKIDEEKCNGCGQCVGACAEGAIEIIDGKAKLVSDVYCDGLGACLGHCPQGAITVEKREAASFDEQAAMDHAAKKDEADKGCGGGAGGGFTCPGMQMKEFERKGGVHEDTEVGGVESQLGHWPVQLTLLSPGAPYFQNADLLLAADCVPFAMADFHQRYLRGRAVAVGCPKLDETGPYVDKLAEIIRNCKLRSLTVVHMQVPCCSGLTQIAQQAIAQSGVALDFEDVTISLEGEVLRSEEIRVNGGG